MFAESLADERESLIVYYFGDPGSGKTTNAAALARVGKTLFYPIEPGLKQSALATHEIPLDNIIPRRKTSCRDMMMDFWQLKAKLEDDPDCYRGVVFDSTTALTKLVRKRLLKETYAKGVRDAEEAGEEYEKPRNWMPQERYGELMDEIGEVVEHFSTLPVHLAFTAHVRRDEDDDGETAYWPATTPGVQQYMSLYADIQMLTRQVGKFDDGRLIFVGTSSLGGKYKVKDRFNKLPSTLVTPTMDRIISYVNGELTQDNDPLQKEYLEWSSSQAKIRKRKDNEE